MSALDTRVGKKKLVDAAANLSLEAFVSEFTGFYLVSAENPDELPTAFRTTHVNKLAKALAPRSASSEFEIHRIAKAHGNPYHDRVSLGRARNCDVVIRHASISKLHAHFRECSDGGLELTDLDSKNHTLVNGERLPPALARRVDDGDMLQFGVVEVAFVSCEALYDWL